MSTILGRGGRSKLRILFLGTESLYSRRALEQLLEGECCLCGILIAGRVQPRQNAQPAFPELPVRCPPSVQWLVNPAYNPDDDQIWVFSVRWRLTL